MRLFNVASCAGLTIALASCVQVPVIDGPANVPLNDIVKRVKCDLYSAIDRKFREDHRFEFLTQWSAKVRLSVAVDGQAAANPGATVLTPLNAPGTSFNFGVGAGLTTQAIRTEDIEFFIYFPELEKEITSIRRAPAQFAERYDSCVFEDGILLESNLDIGSMFDRALAPVGAGTLYTGHNVPSGSGAPPIIPPSEAANIQRTLEQMRSVPPLKVPSPRGGPGVSLAATDSWGELYPELRWIFERIAQDSKIPDPVEKEKMIINAAIARQVEQATEAVSKNIVAPIWEIASSGPAECQKTIAGERTRTVTKAAFVSIKRLDVNNAKSLDESNTALEAERKALNETINHAKTMLTSITTCKPKKEAPPPQAQYDPLDLISETINFYVTSTGSVAPSWKLVRVTAPISPTFVSGTRKDTNTLTIAMARPDTKEGPPKATTSQTFQILSSTLSQALATRPIGP